MPANYTDVEKSLWEAADELRANSKLKSSEYSVPVLGLIFLRYADQKFTQAERELAALQESSRRRRTSGKLDYQARGVMYLPEAARFSKLLNLPEATDLGGAINDAMRAIENENEELKAGNVLPKNYKNLGDEILLWILKVMPSVRFTSISWASSP